MIVIFSILLGTLTYFFYNSKDEVDLLEKDYGEEQTDEELYKDIEDLFI